MLRLKTKKDFFNLSLLGKISVCILFISFIMVFILYIPYSFNKINNIIYSSIFIVCTGVCIICSSIARYDQIYSQKKSKKSLGILILTLEIISITILIFLFLSRVNT